MEKLDILTLTKFKELPHNKIFATGVFADLKEDIDVEGSGRMMRWVATKGAVDDWAIYYSSINDLPMTIKEYGTKITNPKHIKKLVDCTDEVLEVYRR